MHEQERKDFEMWREMLHENWKNDAMPRYVIARMMFASPEDAKKVVE